MHCPSCGHEPPAGSPFCNGCGAKLVIVCASCGATPPPGSRFCNGCGATLGAVPASAARAPAGAPSPARAPRDYTPKHLADKILQSKSALEGERKQVTVLFADVKGSMELAEQLDPEEWHRILDRFFAILADGVHRFEGTVNQYLGDGIMALFGAPLAHEDHAQRACYAALHLREELARYATELKREHGVGFQARMGLNSGEVVVGSIGDDLRMDYTAQGHTVGLAQRMENLAEPGTCYVSADTAQLVAGYFELADLGAFRVKGAAEPVGVFELRGAGALRTRFDASRARGLSRFVGRDADMQALEAALAQAQGGSGQVVGIVAEAGTGKSRLCFEFVERCRARGMTVNEGHAVAHGKNLPFLPMLEVFRNTMGIRDADSDRVVREKIAGRLLLADESLRELLPVVFEFFGVPDPQRPVPPRLDPEVKQRQLFAVLRKSVRQEDGDAPRVWLIEDLHWIDAGSEAFLEQWVDAIDGSRGLLLLNFRPEYHAAWISKSWYRQIPLAPLGPEAVRALLGDLLGADASTAGLAEAIHARTGGNPFFTEEVVQSLIESGALAGARGSYRLVTPVAKLEVPTTVQALLAARIDRLGEREKQVLQAAAVIGKDFSEPILLRVVGEISRVPLAEADLRASLRALKDGEFVYEQSLYPVAEYAFKHPLTQEVALRSQLQERRKRAHAAVAHALEQANAERQGESAALLAHHYEEAGEAAPAARWHRRAAEWAGRNNVESALQHWQRVRALARQLAEGEEATALTILACSRALAVGGWRAGGVAQDWAEVFAEGCAAAERAGDLAALAMLHTNYSGVRGHNHGSASDYVRYAAEAARIADRTADPALRCGTRAFLSVAHLWAGQLREAERAADEVIALARDDADLGAETIGYRPLFAALLMRLHGIGFSRGPEIALREFPVLRQRALDSGWVEQALWATWFEAELRYALEISDGARTLAGAAARLAENRGAGNQIAPLLVLCAALALNREWKALLDTAGDGLRLIRERNLVRLSEPLFLAHIGGAQLGLGDFAAGRAAAAEGVASLRSSGGILRPDVYAVLARAQLALHEPAADITATLDEYAALVARTGFALFEGELHELRARLAEREGGSAERAAALESAHACYVRFGMTAQAARVRAAAEGAA